MSPGELATYTVVRRHTFLRDLEQELPKRVSLNVSDDPFKVDRWLGADFERTWRIDR